MVAEDLMSYFHIESEADQVKVCNENWHSKVCGLSFSFLLVCVCVCVRARDFSAKVIFSYLKCCIQWHVFKVLPYSRKISRKKISRFRSKPNISRF